jgi:hypothetical protein
MDTEGSEVHIMELPAPIKAEKGAEFTFTVRDAASCSGNCIAVRWAGREAGQLGEVAPTTRWVH